MQKEELIQIHTMLAQMKNEGRKEGEEKRICPSFLNLIVPACAHKRALYQHAGLITVIK